MERRVVITGMDMITPLAIGMEETWKLLLEGKSGIGNIEYFDCSTFQTRIAGEVKGFDINNFISDTSKFKYYGKHSLFSIATTKMALDNSKIDLENVDKTNIGVYLGSGEGQFDFCGFAETIINSWDDEKDQTDLVEFLRVGMNILDPVKELEHLSGRPAAHIASVFELYGPNANCLTACAASSQAIGEAWSIIKRGDAEVMVTGGAHSMIHPLGVIGFNLLTALSTQNDTPKTASKPFDNKRDGFVLGEGAAILILEELEHALKRDAHIWGEIIGYGTSSDSYRITDAHPEGRGAISAVKRAFDTAKIKPEEIDYISAHGTSTKVNDKVETLAIKEIFGQYAKKTPISSTKSMLGHLIAAAGASELIVCMLAMRDNKLPPTINYHDPDPSCDLDYIPNKYRSKEINTVLSNSFGFGGQNVSLIARKYPFNK